MAIDAYCRNTPYALSSNTTARAYSRVGGLNNAHHATLRSFTISNKKASAIVSPPLAKKELVCMRGAVISLKRSANHEARWFVASQ
jgi:hypothetical protein